MKHFALHGLLPFVGHPPPFITRTNEPTDDGCSRTCVNAAFIKVGAQHGTSPVQTPTCEKEVRHLAKQGGGAHGPREKILQNASYGILQPCSPGNRLFQATSGEG